MKLIETVFKRRIFLKFVKTNFFSFKNQKNLLRDIVSRGGYIIQTYKGERESTRWTIIGIFMLLLSLCCSNLVKENRTTIQLASFQSVKFLLLPALSSFFSQSSFFFHIAQQTFPCRRRLGKKFKFEI